MMDGKGIHSQNIPGTFLPVQNKTNDYLIDRASQKAGIHYSGVEGIAMQDASLQESMGPIQDRAREHLVSTDNGIIMVRHRLIRAAKALLENDINPPGTDSNAQRIRSVAMLMPRNAPFMELAEPVMQAVPGKPHQTV
jgi:hypothetical protein